MKYQLIPPNLHPTNSAERSIQNFKDNLIVGLASVDPSFLIQLWCRILPLATTTLKLLQPSHLHPKISSEALINGAFDYNKTPIALLGKKIIVHKTPVNQKTWPPHGVDGLYIDRAPGHYRLHKVYTPKTRSERIARLVEFPRKFSPFRPHPLQMHPQMQQETSQKPCCIHIQAPLSRQSTIINFRRKKKCQKCSPLPLPKYRREKSYHSKTLSRT